MFGQVEYTTIPVDIDNAALQRIADVGGGKFFRAADTEAMHHVYDEINRLETSKVSARQYNHFTEYFMWSVYLPAYCFSVLNSRLAHTRLRRFP